MRNPAGNAILKGAFSAFLALLISFAWIILVSPWMGSVESDPDEGINLAKASLLARGIGPYGEIWNDQPPLLTLILGGLQRLHPFDVHTARLLVVIFASAMLAALFATVRQQAGLRAALATLLLLGISPLFLRLSASVMVGLPAISLAVLALCLLLRNDRGLASVLCSGLLLALALQTKLFVFMMAPSLAYALFSQGRASWRAAACWMLALIPSFLGIALVTGQPLLSGNIAPHVAATQLTLPVTSSPRMIFDFLIRHPTVLLCGTIGLGLALRRRKTDRLAMASVLWLLTALPLLLLHSPFWYHHALMLLVPFCLLSGPVLAETLGPRLASFRGDRSRLGIACAVMATLLYSGALLVRTGIDPRGQADLAVAQRALTEFSPPGDLVVTDRPILAYNAGLTVPPELAVWSRKRMALGQLTDADILRVIRRDRPRQILLQRFPASAALLDSLARDYVRTRRLVSSVHLLRRDLARQATVAVSPAPLLRRIEAVTGGTTFAPRYDGAGRPLGEDGATLAEGSVWLRPPAAAYQLGEALLDAHEETGTPGSLALALAIARRIVAVQNCDGSWPVSAVPERACRLSAERPPSFDEGMAAGIIRFLARAADHLPPAQQDPFHRAVASGLRFLVSSQNPDGGWPIIPGARTYAGLSALNDTVTPAHIAVLLDFSEGLQRQDLVASAKRGLAFLLSRQLPSGAWAQQYDGAGRPAPARAFEPAAASSLETAYAMGALISAHAALHDESYLAAAIRAADWLKGSTVGAESWARFYDLDTNLPIYVDRDGTLHYDHAGIPPDQQPTYRWLEHFPEVADALSIIDAIATGGQAAGAAVERDLRLVRTIMLASREPRPIDAGQAVETSALIRDLQTLSRQ